MTPFVIGFFIISISAHAVDMGLIRKIIKRFFWEYHF